MKITTISYQVTKNLGNNESERFEASAVVNETEDVGEAASYLREWVNWQLKFPPRYRKPKLLDRKYKDFAREFRYQEFDNGDYYDEKYEDENLFKQNIELKANEYLRRGEMLGEFFSSDFDDLREAILAEFGLRSF